MTIIEYHRPQKIEEVLKLLARPSPQTYPLAGGSALNRPSAESFAVVDLQELRLDTVERRGNILQLGATLTLQTLLELPDLPPALQEVIQHEASYNLRQVATVAGTLIAAGGRSPFTTALLALDAALIWRAGGARRGGRLV
jgi:CO/xanthine dehydrogenase FAD-binding subunit